MDQKSQKKGSNVQYFQKSFWLGWQQRSQQTLLPPAYPQVQPQKVFIFGQIILTVSTQWYWKPNNDKKLSRRALDVIEMQPKRLFQAGTPALDC